MDMGTVKVTSEEYSVECSSEKLDIYTDYEGSYSVQPSYEAQTLPTDGKVMTGDVTVGAIPAGLVDVSSTTAEASDVALGKVFFDSTGTQSTGSLHYDTYAGEYSVQPSYEAQTLQTSGKLMGDNVMVGAIPAGLVDVSSTTAVPADVVEGRVFFDSTGTQTVGTLSTHVPSLDDPILFFDYDGTLVASYTEPPSELPPLPTHERLCNGVWNYTLADIEAEYEVMGQAYVGANYETVSGATEIDIELTDPNWLSPYLMVQRRGTVTVDWGDGTVDTVTGGGDYAQAKGHTYQSTGRYTIKVSRTDMRGNFLYLSDNNMMLLNANSTSNGRSEYYYNAVKAVRLGNYDSIGQFAFYKLHCLETVSLPPTLTALGGSGCFNNTSSLKHLTVPRGMTTTFNMTSSGVKTVSLPKGLTTIGYQDFKGASRLERIAVPSTCSSWYYDAFQNCVSLSSVKIPTSLVGSSSWGYFPNFQGCTNLREIKFAGPIKQLSQRFATSLLIRHVELPDGIVTINQYAFSGCTMLASVSIPDSVTLIESYAFSSCAALSSITFPETVTSIPQYVCNGCYSLKNVVFLGSVTTLGSSCFTNCYTLERFTVPATVTSIGNYAFSGNTSMKEYHVLPTTPPTMGSNAFQNIPANCKIYVPAESLEAYQTASNWSTYASYMVGE